MNKSDFYRKKFAAFREFSHEQGKSTDIPCSSGPLWVELENFGGDEPATHLMFRAFGDGGRSWFLGDEDDLAALICALQEGLADMRREKTNRQMP